MQRWVDDTLTRMTLDEKVGQLLVPSLHSIYTSSDSEAYDELIELVNTQRVGGFLVFGARKERPDVLLGRDAPRVSLGQPLDAASLVNRLQDSSVVPLLVAADFETGLGFRMGGGTAFPQAMAFGAVGDARLAREAGPRAARPPGRLDITAIEARAIGVHLNLAPVVDVNNNPKNPVINTNRSLNIGESAHPAVGSVGSPVPVVPGRSVRILRSSVGSPVPTSRACNPVAC